MLVAGFMFMSMFLFMFTVALLTGSFFFLALLAEVLTDFKPLTQLCNYLAGGPKEEATNDNE